MGCAIEIYETRDLLLAMMFNFMDIEFMLLSIIQLKKATQCCPGNLHKMKKMS